MKPVLRFASLLVLAALVVIPLQPAFAGGTQEGRVIFGQSFTLKSGETLNGDLTVFGGSATIEEGAMVNGNTTVLGGNLTIDGNVTGDATIMGGIMELGAKSHVYGNLTSLGATINRQDGSLVDGQITNAGTSWVKEGAAGSVPPAPGSNQNKPSPGLNIKFDPLTSILSTFGQAFGLAVLAMLVMLFLAAHADRVAHAVIAQPVVAGGLGLLTMIALPVVLVALGVLSIMIVTLILTVPLMIILLVAWGIAELFGWIAMGYEIGQRLTRAFHKEWHPAFSAGLGTFLLTLVANGASILNFIPGLQCITWIIPSLVSLFALGAVIMTRFGTMEVAAPVKPVEEMPASPKGKK